MTDPADDAALTWEGDDRLQAPAGPAPRLADDRPERGAGRVAGGSVALLVLGVLGGVAVIETLFWIRAVFEPAIEASVTLGDGSPGATAAFAANLGGRVLAVASPLIWFVVVCWRVRAPSRRLALLLLGAVLLVPWPAVLAVS